MAILVDYVCSTCRGRSESWVASPPPATGSCPACGAVSRRAWAAVGVVSGAAAPTPRPARRPADPLCVRNPDVPGLCHLSESAGRAWVARARGDNRALDRELERQEKAAAVTPPSLADVVAHDHGHGHRHGHDPVPAGG
jgi:hypothetical protein